MLLSCATTTRVRLANAMVLEWENSCNYVFEFHGKQNGESEFFKLRMSSASFSGKVSWEFEVIRIPQRESNFAFAFESASLHLG
jgi:hypothetical protein